MDFKELVTNIELSPTEQAFIDHTCRSWIEFSNAVGQMSRDEVLKVLKYLITIRPHSRTYGERAVQRFNSLNKVRWGDLTDGE